MKTKRLLSALLAFVILVSTFVQVPITVSAANKTVRDTVLILDDSGSMEGEPMNKLIDSAEKFCESVLGASGTNRVAIITYSTGAELKCDFTNNMSALQTAINDMDEYGMTNIYDALSIANDLLSKSSANVKNIVLMSDGLPNEGSTVDSGRYDYSDYDGYDYANAVYNQAVSYHPNYYIYTLGFFHNIYGDTKAFASRFMEDLQNAGYYEVEKVEDLEFTFGEIAEDIAETKVTGTFKYPSSFKGVDNDCSATYYYADEYFYDTSMQYNQSLATMSLCLAMSAFGSKDVTSYESKSNNVKNLMEELMFTDFQTTDSFKTKPSTDSIAAAISQKKIQDKDGNIYTLLAVAVRGGGYEQEWASNFTLGKTGNHKGFTDAANQVIDFIKKYISNTGIEGDIKLWITGFSRAAATSNLVAGALDSGTTLGSNVSLNKKDLFAYCFETPAGITDKKAIDDDTTYGNIFNIVNPNDLVTKVAPVTMGFGRYGIDNILPTNENSSNYSSQLSAMLEQYNSIKPSSPPAEDTEYNVDGFQYYKVDLRNMFNSKDVVYEADDYLSMSAFLDDFLYKIVTNHLSREKFVNELQEGVRETCKLVYHDDKKVEDAVDIFIAKITDVDTLINIVWKAMWSMKSAQEEIVKLLKESFSEAGVVDIDDVTDAALPLLSIILQYGVNNVNDVVSIGVNENYKRIFPAHYPELCLAWMQSMDVNYTTDAGEAFSSGSYRIIRINCPVDVNVYDMQGTLVASIIGDKAQKLGTGISSFVNSDGEKLVYLPPDAEYRIDITGTDNGTVTYGINEFSYEVGCVNRLVNYYDVPIEKDRTLKVVVPAYDISYLSNGTANGTNTKYQLTDMDGNVLTPDLDASGTDALNAYHTVTVVSENDTYGTTTGSGIRQTGNYAQVSAFAKEGYIFEGWYVNEQKVSNEEEYRFCVKEDITLIAKFTSSTPVSSGNVKDNDGGNGWIIAIVVLLVLLIAGGVVVLVLFGGKKKSNQDENFLNIPVIEQAEEVRENENQITEDAERSMGFIQVTNGSMNGFSVPIKDGEILYLGKDPKVSNLVFTSDYKNVSRMHCAVTFDAKANRYFVTDSSSNGTYLISKKRLIKGKRTPVNINTVLILANDECTVLLG